MLSKLTFTVDVQEYPDLEIPAVQGDIDSREVTFFLKDGGKALNLSDATATMEYKAKDGRLGSNDCTIENAEQGIVKIILPNYLLNFSGGTKACLTLKEGDKILTSFPFTVRVARSVFTKDDVVETPEFHYLDKFLKDLKVTNDKINKQESDREISENQRGKNEATRKQNESSRVQSENDRAQKWTIIAEEWDKIHERIGDFSKKDFEELRTNFDEHTKIYSEDGTITSSYTITPTDSSLDIVKGKGTLKITDDKLLFNGTELGAGGGGDESVNKLVKTHFTSDGNYLSLTSGGHKFSFGGSGISYSGKQAHFYQQIPQEVRKSGTIYVDTTTGTEDGDGTKSKPFKYFELATSMANIFMMLGYGVPTIHFLKDAVIHQKYLSGLHVKLTGEQHVQLELTVGEVVRGASLHIVELLILGQLTLQDCFFESGGTFETTEFVANTGDGYALCLMNTQAYINIGTEIEGTKDGVALGVLNGGLVSILSLKISESNLGIHNAGGVVLISSKIDYVNVTKQYDCAYGIITNKPIINMD